MVILSQCHHLEHIVDQAAETSHEREGQMVMDLQGDQETSEVEAEDPTEVEEDLEDPATVEAVSIPKWLVDEEDMDHLEAQDEDLLLR
jgi:hypothetical protein